MLKKLLSLNLIYQCIIFASDLQKNDITFEQTKIFINKNKSNWINDLLKNCNDINHLSFRFINRYSYLESKEKKQLVALAKFLLQSLNMLKSFKIKCEMSVELEKANIDLLYIVFNFVNENNESKMRYFLDKIVNNFLI